MVWLSFFPRDHLLDPSLATARLRDLWDGIRGDLLDRNEELISFSLLSRWEEAGSIVASVFCLLLPTLSVGSSHVFLSTC